MRGFGDFQRAQMRKQDPRVHDLFRHVRQTVDALERLMVASASDPPMEPPKTIGTEGPNDRAPVWQTVNKLAYSVKEVQELVGIGRTKLYDMIGSNELRAVKHDRRTLILAKDLREWLEKLPQTRLED